MSTLKSNAKLSLLISILMMFEKLTDYRDKIQDKSDIVIYFSLKKHNIFLPFFFFFKL